MLGHIQLPHDVECAPPVRDTVLRGQSLLRPFWFVQPSPFSPRTYIARPGSRTVKRQILRLLTRHEAEARPRHFCRTQDKFFVPPRPYARGPRLPNHRAVCDVRFLPL